MTHWKRPWCWEGLGAGEGDDRGWDGWMVSPTRWTWVWVKSGNWWWTGRPGVLRFMGWQSRTRLSDWTESKRHSQIRFLPPLIYKATIISFILVKVRIPKAPTVTIMDSADLLYTQKEDIKQPYVITIFVILSCPELPPKFPQKY